VKIYISVLRIYTFVISRSLPFINILFKKNAHKVPHIPADRQTDSALTSRRYNKPVVGNNIVTVSEGQKI